MLASAGSDYHVKFLFISYIAQTLSQGEITTRRQLKHGINEYQMTVKAQVNSKSYAKVIVRFNVRKISANITEIKFASPHYSVIISDNLKRGKTVLHLSLVSPGTSHLVLYNISQNVRYFTIDKDTGKLVIKQDLSKLRLHRNSSRRFEFTVVARLRDCPVVTASVIINVIVIPAHSGDIYRRLVVTKESQLSNIKSSLNAPRAKSPPKAKRSEFGYHRFFRQLSPTARDISRAERKFARVIHELRENVIQQFTGKETKEVNACSDLTIFSSKM